MGGVHEEGACGPPPRRPCSPAFSHLYPPPSDESGIPQILNSCLPLGKILDTLLGCLSCHRSEINHFQGPLSPWLWGRPCFPRESQQLQWPSLPWPRAHP